MLLGSASRKLLHHCPHMHMRNLADGLRAGLNLVQQAGRFAREDDVLDMSDEPDHQELCEREQAYFLRAIHEDLSLDQHLTEAVESLRIVLAADRSIREGRVIDTAAVSPARLVRFVADMVAQGDARVPLGELLLHVGTSSLDHYSLYLFRNS